MVLCRLGLCFWNRKVMMALTQVRNVLSFIVFLLIPFFVSGGSPCPPRDEIYPCICSNILFSKRNTYTLVSCSRLESTDELRSIFPYLRTMRIDRFIIYDSFWEAEKLGAKKDEKQSLPQNWISLLRVKELEIVDSRLSRCFACDSSMPCRNLETTHLKIANSSTTDTICTVCDSRDKRKYSWTGCMSKLAHLHFINNKIITVEREFFPEPMGALVTLNMSHNEITSVGRYAFFNLPNLLSLDLSHNRISSIQPLFGEKKSPVSFIDLSWNQIVTLPSDLFQKAPFIKTFIANNNYIDKLPEETWRNISNTIRTVDLRENPIECDCHIIWMNCTFKVHVSVLGYCLNEEYEDTPLRRVSKYMGERCVDGEVRNRSKTDNETREYCIGYPNEVKKQSESVSSPNENGNVHKGMQLPDSTSNGNREHQNKQAASERVNIETNVNNGINGKRGTQYHLSDPADKRQQHRRRS